MTAQKTAAKTKVSITGRDRSVELCTGLFINNEFVDGHGEAIISVNPADQSTLAVVHSASVEDIDLAVKAARLAANTTWGTHTPATERAALMNKLADIMEVRLEELAILETLDSGKGITWARGDISESISAFRYYAGLAFSGTDGQVLEGCDATGIAFTRQEPLGVVAQIVPWNYPIMMMAWKVAPALAAGCAIVFKPAELTPLATLLFCEMVRDAGYPAGAFNCVNSYGPVGGQALASHMDVDKIAFTGSTNIGKQIAVQAASSNLKHVGLELGGKSPNIVLQSANIEQTAAWCCLGIFENMGQSCTAASRILVHSSIYDEFLSTFIKKASSHKVGDPFDPETYSGPQISKAHLDRIDGYVKSGVSEGAKIVLGGNRLEKVQKFQAEGHWIQGGNFYEPTIFVDAKPWMKIVKEEIFGPVAIVMKFETVEEAIQMANDTEYGLAAGVHTEKQDEVIRVGARLKAGTVWINSYAFCPPNVPFGGYKSSGWGRELGKKGLEEYTITKSYQWNYAQKLNWPFDLNGISKL
ncbi:hypothetical protein MJO28_004971 [Puccinia striiformis f. sp. tritici]|nr:hypothetical protein Pst134EA_009153 [Puccinia striiformis f. sp. tritici]KAI9622160.1 hypothetical protein KEM48_007339 [Puccinia striiformis f. sp. tritici PST-130]KNE96785.1 hypothetical protein, variant [Puccinia striiformis f. sp. tritici PST-78]KAH9457904.1 hypothetical protein Pst134EB_010213 [Puccinia striiformis f. sp. tritici]KAH9468617.1 hypothetical protein Pst134EA_009153 [Puccinia striiformis f. sp. tritici]KAI7954571.1 hypothetical protein MJO28_004971 [Puccinia striiformis f